MLFSPPLRQVSAQKSGDGDGSGGRLTYPATKKVDVVDDYFGTKVPDPYRWLENNDSPEVAAWVEAENKVTFAYLDKIPYRNQLKDRLTKLLNYPKYTSPSRRGEWFVFSKNDGLENQNVYYISKGLDRAPELLLDTNKFSADGTSRLGAFSCSPKGKYVLYGISERGKGKDGNALFFRDLSKADKTFTPIVSEITNDSYGVLDDLGSKFLIRTNHGAPNGKVMLYDPATKTWKDVLPERPEPLENSGTVGGKLFATYLKDVTTRAYVYSLEGKLENEIQLPGLGTANGFGGRNDDKFVFYSFTSFNYPPTIFQYDIASKNSFVFRTVEVPDFHPYDYEVKQVFYNSKDGTRVPMFLTYKKGIKLDGNNPTLLYGYGGFNITTNPSFSSLRLALLEQGVVYASANMRGGGEYGEKWHEAGTKLKKQNVFDDFIAAAEYLIKEKYTSPAKLAIDGASNGGLLVGAVANQRPDLFRAVHQHAGVMDMLRDQKVTIGWNWAADYGRSDANEAEFKALYAYSPVHNVKPGTRYPSILVTTADHDDRVVPAHSFKYAAALQAAQAGDNPVIIRIDTKSGHGASSTTKQLEQTADIDAFIMYSLGVTPKW